MKTKLFVIICLTLAVFTIAGCKDKSEPQPEEPVTEQTSEKSLVTGLEPEVILEAIRLQTSEDILQKEMCVPDDYNIRNTSERVVKLILGMAKLSNLWSGIKHNDLS